MTNTLPLTEAAAREWAARYEEPWKRRAEWCAKFPGRYDEAKKVLFEALQGKLKII